jgi:hypothetical protein
MGRSRAAPLLEQSRGIAVSPLKGGRLGRADVKLETRMNNDTQPHIQKSRPDVSPREGLHATKSGMKLDRPR